MNDDSRVLKLRSNVAVSWSLYLEVAVAEVGGQGRGWGGAGGQQSHSWL